MTNLTEGAMFDADEDANSNGKRILWVLLSSVGMIMLLGAIAGFLSVHMSDGAGPLNAAGYAALGVLVALVLILARTIWKLFQRMQQGDDRAPRRERLNRNIILACTALGGIIGLVIAASGISNPSGDATDPFTALLVGPLPMHIVVLAIIVWGVIMPLILWFWHTRAIDEQEANAYRDGGYYAAYAFLFLTPLWWLLWRGGFLPEPDGVTIYLTFSLVWTAVWFWKKYR